MSHANSRVETMKWIDDGCEISNSCLECPLPQCKYDDLRYSFSTLGARNAKIFQLHTEGVHTQDLVKQFGLAYRTVRRIIYQRGLSLDAERRQERARFVDADDVPGKPLSELGAAYKARKPWPVMSMGGRQ